MNIDISFSKFYQKPLDTIFLEYLGKYLILLSPALLADIISSKKSRIVFEFIVKLPEFDTAVSNSESLC